jgi:hypothetical protein
MYHQGPDTHLELTFVVNFCKYKTFMFVTRAPNVAIITERSSHIQRTF